MTAKKRVTSARFSPPAKLPFVYQQGNLLKGCVLVPTKVVCGLRHYLKMTTKARIPCIPSPFTNANVCYTVYATKLYYITDYYTCTVFMHYKG
jgi:hypothetical protein